MLWLGVLGGARIEGQDGPLRGRAAHRRRLALLALLAATPRASLGRERIVGYLWPEHPPDAARHLLSESLYVLRRELHEELFITIGDELHLNTRVIGCDLIDFRNAVAAAEWLEAVRLYTGPFLDGFVIDEAPEFERWMESERVQTAHDYARALEALAELSASRGESAAATEWWGRLARHDPYSSRIALGFMTALANAGERARAVQFAAAHAVQWREELGLDPDPEILALAERLRSEPPERPELAAPSGPTPALTGAARETPPAEEADLSQLQPDLEVIRSLGTGSVANVYLAREPVLNRLVAIKVLAPRLAEDETARLRFEREAQAAARLHHPNVATVFRIGRLADGVPYLVLPFISSGTLQDRLIATGPLAVAGALRYLHQLVTALAAAHRLGIVHRDVRPANILYDRETDRVLLTDFGLAAVIETGTERILRLTQPGELLGNPSYASPEQLRGEIVTERADVYSLGIVAFELLTCRYPFDAATPLEFAAAHERVAPARVTEFRADVDPALDDLITRCLNKRAEQRPFAIDIAETLASIEPPARDSDHESVR